MIAFYSSLIYMKPFTSKMMYVFYLFIEFCTIFVYAIPIYFACLDKKDTSSA